MGSIGISAAPMIADVVNAWVVPAIIFVLVIVACLLGLRWLRTEHLEELRSVPLFSGLSDHELLWSFERLAGNRSLRARPSSARATSEATST